MKTHQHDTVCEVVWHALLQDRAGCKQEQWCKSDLDHPGDVFHPDIQYGKPFNFDASVHHSLQDSLLCLSAATTGVAAEDGKANKDYHYEAVV